MQESSPRVIQPFSNEAPLNLSIAVAASAISFLFSLGLVLSNVGVTFENFPILFENPAATTEFIAEAFGYSLALPLIHVAVSSLFKSKRTANTRRLIFSGWAVAVILLNLLQIYR